MSLLDRLIKLERASGGEGWEPWGADTYSLDELITKMGADPATERALVAERNCSPAEAVAELLGVSYRDFQAVIKARASEYGASQEWRWQNGRCYVRRTECT